MMEKIGKAKYEYEDIPVGNNQYEGIDFQNELFVDAKYVHALIPSDRGNRYIEALPPPRTEKEILRDYKSPSSRMTLIGNQSCRIVHAFIW